MRVNPRPRPIDAPDDEIRSALEAVEQTPPLLVAVAGLTGEFDLLRDEFRPAPQSFDPTAGISPDAASAARDAAAAALARYRDRGSVPAARPDPRTVARMLEFIAGEAIEPDYVAVLTEELALDGEDLRAPNWRRDVIAPDRPFRVAIVGAGMSGLVAGHRLGQAGVEYVIFEKNAEVGGTWLENRYPGCRVDVPNHFYSYSFAQTNEWPQYYSRQPVLLDYFRACADEFGVREHVRFETEVLDAEWDDAASRWSVTVRDADGRTEAVLADAVVSAVGQLNRPKLPDIEGIDRFAGESFHSARWDPSVELEGRRVAVIGTGASAAQFIPPVAECSAHLTVLQRTPPWLLETPNYHDDLPAGVRWVLDHVPGYANWDRVWFFWRSHEVLVPMAAADDGWKPEVPGTSVSMLNDAVRALFTEYFRTQFADEPELLAAVVPQYPPFAKRFVRDNGIWARTLTRDDVTLDTGAIECITEHGVRMADGTVHEVDVIIYGTGFQASSFLTPMTVRGRGAVDLHATWHGEARAYLGLTVPRFPNFFLMYGPNTNIVINGSIIYFSELEARYIVESIRMLLEGRDAAMDVRAEVHHEYNEHVDAANRAMAWGASSVNAWYKNAAGVVTQNWPFSLLEFWQRTRHPDPADYEIW